MLVKRDETKRPCIVAEVACIDYNVFLHRDHILPEGVTL